MRKLTDLQHAPAAAGWERRRRETEQALLSAGRELFVEKGFDATSVADIAAKAGVGLRTFYRYFPSKEWIACHGVFRFAVDGVEAVRRRPDTESPIESLIQATYDLEKADYDAALALDALLVETVPAVAGVQHFIVVAAQDELTEIFAARLGVPPTSLDARAPATAATLAYQASTRLWWSRHESGEPNPSTIWELGRQILGSMRLLTPDP
jgi:AcrR family transcriptional regulator